MQSFRFFITLFTFSYCSFSALAQENLTLEDIFLHQKLSPLPYQQLQFVNGEKYTFKEEDTSEHTSRIWSKSIAVDEKSLLFDSKVLKEKYGLDRAYIDNFQYVEDGVYLVHLKKESVYRYSYKSQVYLIKTASRQFIQLAEGQKIMLATISPDNKKVAYVRDNNIFIFNIDNGKVEQVTRDGKWNHIINGATDWSYEEEFELVNSLRWSDNSEYLAYLKFDESEVKEFTIDYYGNDYPEKYTYKYPRAGEKISKVSAWVYKNKKNHVQIPVSDDYIPRLRWKNNQTLALMSINRLQNHLKVHTYDVKSKKSSIWYEEKDKRYVDIPQIFSIIAGDQLAITSEKSGYNHLYVVDGDGIEHQVTKGEFEIKDVLRLDMQDSLVVFSSHLPTPERESVLLWDMKSQLLQYLSDTTGVAQIQMLGGGYFQESFSNQYVRSKISIKSLQSSVSKVLHLDQRNEDSLGIKKEFFWLSVDDYVLRAWKMVPPGFDSSKTYPVLFYVYGGPGSQTVTENWGRNQQHWLKYMAQQGFIVVSVDGRGTFGRGAEFKKSTYGRFGQVDVQDQLKTIQYFKQLPYVDSTQTYMFGWSYGGYMTLMCMMQEEQYLTGGISVAPVTDWKFYDAIYTERYMRTPKGNPTGYQKGSAVQQAHLHKGELLLIHGTADDNVHYQNTLEAAKKLIQHDKNFMMLSYPNGRHGIGGTSTQYHLYRSMTDFLLRKREETQKVKLFEENNSSTSVIVE